MIRKAQLAELNARLAAQLADVHQRLTALEATLGTVEHRGGHASRRITADIPDDEVYGEALGAGAGRRRAGAS